MIDRYTISFTVWILLVVFNQMVLSITLQFNPSSIYNIWKVLWSIILRSCPGIVCLPIRMVGNLNVVNRIVSELNLSHSFCLYRLFFIQTFHNVGGHRYLRSENCFFCSRSLRNSFLDVIYLHSVRGVS